MLVAGDVYFVGRKSTSKTEGTTERYTISDKIPHVTFQVNTDMPTGSMLLKLEIASKLVVEESYTKVCV